MQSRFRCAELRDGGLLVLPLLAVNDLGREPTLPVERTDLAGVIDRARDGDELMLRPGLAELLQPLKAGVDDVPIAQRRQRDPAAEPLLFLELHHLIKRVGA
ncbi:hypothetical protein CNY89_21170, partial [Amaricoccus sp. HAR-UPW-R2A-40]